MWIRTQNKKELVNVIKFEIASIFGDKKDYSKIIQSDYNLIIKRKLGVCFHYVTKEKEELINDNEAKVIYTIDLSKVMKVLE